MTDENAQTGRVRRRRRRLRKRFLIPFVLLGGFVILQPMGRSYALRRAAKDADEVRIVLYTPEGHERPMVRIAGRDKVDEFLDLIALKPSILSCMCGGMEEIQLVRADEPLVRLNYGRGKLMWMGGRWYSDGHLTVKSASQTYEWIKANGGSDLVNARTQVKKLWKDWKAQMEKEFPDPQPATVTSVNEFIYAE